MHFNIGNSYTQVTGDRTPEADKLLHQWCTKEYDYYGLDFSQRPPRRTKKTDYIRYFKYDKFPTGWSGQFIERLKEKDVPVTWRDCREKPSPTPLNGSACSVPPLRDYQQAALEKCLSVGRGVVHHATGAGKTVVMAAVLKELGLNSIIIVPTINLLNQTEQELKEMVGEENVGRIGDSSFDPALFTVSTVQSLWSRFKTNDHQLSLLFEKCDVLIMDEAHHINIAGKDKIQNTYFQIALQLNAFYKIGLTATPGKVGSLERELLEGATGRVLHHVSSSVLIERGLLARPDIQIYRITPTQRYSDWQLAYRENILRNAKRNHLICDLARKYSDEGKSVLITVTRVAEHGAVLNEMMPDAIFMSGSTKGEDRVDYLKDFASKKSPILISTVVNEGVNIPALDVIILAGGGKSIKQTVQRIGRALRTSKGKALATIIDFYDKDNGMLERHSKARMRVYKSEPSFNLKKVIDVD
jgi:superfamily II DNA or RNA helicase